MDTQTINMTCKETQPFGVINPANQIAHTGRDFYCGFGSYIYPYWGNEYVYKVLTKQNPANDGTGFTGVFTIVDNGVECFEFLYGHGNPLTSVGQTVQKDTLIGTQANNGEVYSNGIRITLDMQKAGDTRGTHRHDQKRPLIKTKILDLANKTYITGLGNDAYRDASGFYYEIANFNNGFRGCVNWEGTPSSQNIATGNEFNNLMKAVKAFQLANGILDFANETNLKKIIIGAKTLAKIKQIQNA